MPTTSSVLYFQGTTRTSGGSGSVFGDGKRCASGSVIRLGARVNVGGTSVLPSGADPALHVSGSDSAGDVRTYQAWYRDNPTFCTSGAFNLTNAVAVVWR